MKKQVRKRLVTLFWEAGVKELEAVEGNSEYNERLRSDLRLVTRKIIQWSNYYDDLSQLSADCREFAKEDRTLIDEKPDKKPPTFLLARTIMYERLHELIRDKFL